MQTIEVTRFGGPEVLEVREAPDPEPGPGEVRIAVEIVEIIFLDTQLRAGWGQDFFPMRPPWVPGTGVAGTIAAVGDGVAAERVGARVVARTGDAGAYAEQVVVPEGEAFDVPDELPLDVATAVLHDAVLALEQLDYAELKAGDRVLVTAAAGALGHWFVPLGKAVGATVVGAAGGPAKVAAVRELGADLAVDYLDDDWAAAAGDGFDAVFDGAGGNAGRAALGLVRPGGVYLGYGAASGDFGAMDAGARSDVRIVSIGEPRETAWERHTREGLRLLAAGTVRPAIGQRVPLAEAARAHQAIAERKVVGKSLLVV